MREFDDILETDSPSDFSMLAKRDEGSLKSSVQDHQENTTTTSDHCSSPKPEELAASEAKKKLKILKIKSEVGPNPDLETYNYKIGKMPSFKSVNLENIQNYLFFNRCRSNSKSEIFFANFEFFFNIF